MSWCFGTKKKKAEGSKVVDPKNKMVEKTQQPNSNLNIPAGSKNNEKAHSGIFMNGQELQQSRMKHQVMKKNDIQYQVSAKQKGDLAIKGKNVQKIDVGVHALQPNQMVRYSNYFDESRNAPNAIGMGNPTNYQTNDETDLNRGLKIKRFIYDEGATNLV